LLPKTLIDRGEMMALNRNKSVIHNIVWIKKKSTKGK
jgi:hypothetical protein